MSEVLSESGEILYTQTATATYVCPEVDVSQKHDMFVRTVTVPLSASELRERGRIVLPREVECLFHPGQHMAVLLDSNR